MMNHSIFIYYMCTSGALKKRGYMCNSNNNNASFNLLHQLETGALGGRRMPFLHLSA